MENPQPTPKPSSMLTSIEPTQTAVPSTPVPVTPKKGVSKMLISLLALAVIGVLGYFFYMKYTGGPIAPVDVENNLDEIPLVTPTTDNSMEGWKALVVNDLSFKYPVDWQLETNQKALDVLLKPLNLAPEDSHPSIGIYTMDNAKNLSVKDFQEEASQEGPTPSFYSDQAEKRIVSGVDGYFLINQGCEPLLCDKFTLSYKGKIYAAQVIYPSTVDAEIRNTFIQIISTFEFTDSTTSDFQQTGIFSAQSLIEKNICERKYSTWENFTVADALKLKAPSYFKQNQDYGGQDFEISHPREGNFSLTTSLIGDYDSQKTDEFYETLFELVNSRKDDFKSYTYYGDGDYTYVIGNGMYTIVAKDVIPPRWWMISVIPQDISSDTLTVEKSQRILNDEDYKCVLRSVKFN